MDLSKVNKRLTDTVFVSKIINRRQNEPNSTLKSILIDVCRFFHDSDEIASPFAAIRLNRQLSADSSTNQLDDNCNTRSDVSQMNDGRESPTKKIRM